MAIQQHIQAGLPVVAVINTTLETLELLQSLLEEEKFTVITAYVIEFKRGLRNLHDFFTTHRPQAVVYDIAMPYVENWTYFREHVLGLNILHPAQFVLTTTNKAVLENLVGSTQSIELIGRPFDLEIIVQAVHHAIKTHS